MPKYEFIGTKGSGYHEQYLYRDDKGKVIEVPVQVANSSDKENALFEQKKRALQEENHNAHRYRMANRATPEKYPFPTIPENAAGMPDFARGVSNSTPEMRRRQDIQQVQRNRANIDFREAALAALPSQRVAPTPPVATPDAGLPVVGAPPVEQLARVETDEDRLKRALMRGPWGQSPAQYKTGMR